MATIFISYILVVVILLPITGSIFVLLSNKIAWRIGLWFSNITIILSILLWATYNPITTGTQFIFVAGDYQHFGTITLGLDGISLYFLILTTFITPICILSGRKSITNNINSYIALFLVLETFLCLVFTVQDIILFYVFFESVLIPLFLVVGIYGSAGTIKIRASYLLFLYTLFGSLAILLAFVSIYYYTGTTNIQLLSLYNIDLTAQKILFAGVILSIAIKTPIVPFNTWLTFAHSEAPVGGSIILAGVILKLATYGYIRIVLTIFPDASYYYSPIIQLFAAISVIYASLATIRQTDYKRLIAYSSVAHIGLVVIGVFSGTIEGILGAILLSLAHGIVSPALFYLVGGVLYDRYHTRIVRYYRGLTIYIPVFSTFFFFFSISNAAVPLTGNWAGEFITIAGVFYNNPIAAIIGATGIVLSAVYSIWLYSRICFGTWSPYINYTIRDINRREIAVLLPLLFFTILLGIIPQFVINDINIPIVSLLYSL